MNDIKIIKHRGYLETVVFNRKKDYFGPIQVNTIDSFKNVKLTNNILRFNFVRHVSINPEALFDVEVTFLYEAELTPEAVQIYKNKKIEIPELVSLTNMTTLPQHASTIIANLTGVNKSNPLVTVPICTAK